MIDAVGLEQYLRGVVPAEMPSDWPPEALKAQAVAARSYALANLAKGRPFDLYGDTRSQVYGGIAAESPAASAAVAATSGEVVLYRGTVADTLFFSTSGGRTASALESTGTAVPYLVPVSDPYDVLSPYHDWGPVVVDAATVAKKLKLSGPIADVQASNGPSGRVRSMTFVSEDGSEVTVTGSQVRTALDLRSTWFSVGAAAAPARREDDDLRRRRLADGCGPWRGCGVPRVEDGGAAGLGAGGRASDGPRRRVLDGRPAAGDDAVPPRLGGCPGRAREDRGCAASRRDRRRRFGQRVDQARRRGRAGSAATAVGCCLVDGLVLGHRPVGSLGLSGALPAGTYRVRCAPGQGLAAGVSATLLLP